MVDDGKLENGALQFCAQFLPVVAFTPATPLVPEIPKSSARATVLSLLCKCNHWSIGAWDEAGKHSESWGLLFSFKYGLNINLST
jgi:hypothetical protein